jgi:hypothetical protein
MERLLISDTNVRCQQNVPENAFEHTEAVFSSPQPTATRIPKELSFH